MNQGTLGRQLRLPAPRKVERSLHVWPDVGGRYHLWAETVPPCWPIQEIYTVCVRKEPGFSAGMQALGDGPGYERTHGPDNVTRHPDHHYGTPGMIQALQAVADSFRVYYPTKLLGYNDMSLRWGGVFDISSSSEWHPPHCGHRSGVTCDVRSRNLNKLQRRKLEELLRKNGFGKPYMHLDHWHCTLR